MLTIMQAMAIIPHPGIHELLPDVGNHLHGAAQPVDRAETIRPERPIPARVNEQTGVGVGGDYTSVCAVQILSVIFTSPALGDDGFETLRSTKRHYRHLRNSCERS